MRDKISGIYCIENKFNNKKYIGKSINVDRRFSVHKRLLRQKKHGNTHLQNAYNKDGLDSFNFYLIQECPYELLNALEIEIINEYQSDNPNFGYNKTIGGEGVFGYKYSDDIKNKMSINMMGNKNHFFGKTHSDETKNKISKTKKGTAFQLKNITPEEFAYKKSISQSNKKRKGKNNHTGVYYYPQYSEKKPWQAKINLNGKRFFLGMFESEILAINAWENKYLKYFGKKYDSEIKKEKMVYDSINS